MHKQNCQKVITDVYVPRQELLITKINCKIIRLPCTIKEVKVSSGTLTSKKSCSMFRCLMTTLGSVLNIFLRCRTLFVVSSLV